LATVTEQSTAKNLQPTLGQSRTNSIRQPTPDIYLQTTTTNKDSTTDKQNKKNLKTDKVKEKTGKVDNFEGKCAKVSKIVEI
jgi:hypothetical protein